VDKENISLKGFCLKPLNINLNENHEFITVKLITDKEKLIKTNKYIYKTKTKKKYNENVTYTEITSITYH